MKGDRMPNLYGKTILVTGAGGGIGAATARALAEANARLVLADINESAAEEIASEIRSGGGDALACRVDVVDEASVAKVVALALDHYGALNGSCVVAGIGPARKQVHEMPLDEWSRVIAVNLTGAFLSLKHSLAAMVPRKSGSIVVVASTASVLGTAGGSDYCASKSGLLGLLRSASIENAQRGIRINGVLPGATSTPLFEGGLSEEHIRRVAAEHPMGRLGQPVEIARAMRWLLSDEASFVTGACFAIDGGRMAI
jgi:2,5-dichloro-2,5-cyclohexadiene-1,4-diol dehydrogenase 1